MADDGGDATVTPTPSAEPTARRPPPLPRHRRRRRSTAAGAISPLRRRSATTGSGSPSPAAPAATDRSPGRRSPAPLRHPRGQRTRRSRCPRRRSRPRGRASGRLRQLAGGPSRCAKASARTAARRPRRWRSPPTAAPASRAARSRSAPPPRCARDGHRPADASLGDAIVSAAAAPNGDGRVFAISRQGGASLYTPGRGWTYPNTGLTPAIANERYVALRAVAWPRPDVLIGVGSAGALVTALREPVPFDSSSEARRTTRGDDLQTTRICRSRRRCWPSPARGPIRSSAPPSAATG